MARRRPLQFVSNDSELHTGPKTTHPCAWCDGPATKKCVACKRVSYCCTEHQKNDWKAGHKLVCNETREVSFQNLNARQVAYWNADGSGPWRGYLHQTDGDLTICHCTTLAFRTALTAWAQFVSEVAAERPGELTDEEQALAMRWAYAPKRHSWDCINGMICFLVRRVGGLDIREHRPRDGYIQHRATQMIIAPEHFRTVRTALQDYALNILLPPLTTIADFDAEVALDEQLADSPMISFWCTDLCLKHHVPSRCNFELVTDRSPPNGDAWLKVFLKFRAIVFSNLGITEDPLMPMSMARTLPLLAKALAQSKCDPPPCINRADIKTLRERLRSCINVAVMSLMPGQELVGLDSKETGMMSGWDLRLLEFQSMKGGLDAASKSVEADALERILMQHLR